MDDVELVPLGSEPGAAETAVGLTGPQADEVLERMGLPTLAEPMTGTRVEWNGLDLRILRGFGVLAPHYEIWTPASGLTQALADAFDGWGKPGRNVLTGGVSDCRGDSGVWDRHDGTRLAAGDLADAGA